MKFKAIVEIEGETVLDLLETLEELKQRQVVGKYSVAIHKVKITGEELEYKDVKII